MNLITCKCCDMVFDPLEDPMPDTLLVDPLSEKPVIVVLDSERCWPCREVDDRPMTHAMRHAKVD